ncbi:MAG: PPC domain-containing DNA-binding protein [Ginsengibacter sp.]
MHDTTETSYVLRLLPGADLYISIKNFVSTHSIEAGWIVSCAGSLSAYSIRFANQKEAASGKGYFEIVSLSGTVSLNGSHVHMSISDSTGNTIGGHLMDGCKIYTTAEIVLVASDKYLFTREKEEGSSWKELKITKKQTPH